MAEVKLGHTRDLSAAWLMLRRKLGGQAQPASVVTLVACLLGAMFDCRLPDKHVADGLSVHQNDTLNRASTLSHSSYCVAWHNGYVSVSNLVTKICCVTCLTAQAGHKADTTCRLLLSRRANSTQLHFKLYYNVLHYRNINSAGRLWATHTHS